MQKTIIGFVMCALVAGGAGFFGGMQFQKSQQTSSSNPSGYGGRQIFLNVNGQTNRQGGQGRQYGMRRGGNGFTTGEIISMDDKSITIKTPDGGSKIVLLSPSMTVNTFVAASSTDLKVGEQVMATGEANPDGSMTAEAVQVRPASEMPRPQGAAQGQ